MQRPDANKGSTTEKSPVAGLDIRPVVGIGFSADGLQAFKDFLKGINPQTKAAYVVVPHLSPDDESKLLEIVREIAPLPAKHLADGQSIEPGSIHVLNQNAEVSLQDGIFHLSPVPRKEPKGSTIDRFFGSLSRTEAEMAVGIVLSKSDTEGTVGLQKIKAHGGMCLAQSSDEVKFSDMAESALESGCIHFVGAARDLARKVDDYFDHRGEPLTDAGAAKRQASALICDDHSATCRILRRMLADDEVTVVENEDELYKNLEGKKILLLDINLNGQERGIEIMKKLRADPRTQSLRIIAFTAHCLPGQKEAFLKMGFDDYLSKPFKKEALIEKLFI